MSTFAFIRKPKRRARRRSKSKKPATKFVVTKVSTVVLLLVPKHLNHQIVFPHFHFFFLLLLFCSSKFVGFSGALWRRISELFHRSFTHSPCQRHVQNSRNPRKERDSPSVNQVNYSARFQQSLYIICPKYNLYNVPVRIIPQPV